MKKWIICEVMVLLFIIAPVAALEWDWATDGWNGWSHTGSWSGTAVGPNYEYGPFMESGRGEHGTYVNLLAGTTSASVERDFVDPTGTGWDSFIFRGSITASDVPNGRWVTIEINDQPVFNGNAVSSPPGNGQNFEIVGSFPQSSEVKIKISHGQDPAWGNYFLMRFDSLELTGSDQGISVPEFPSASLPILFITGFIGAVFLIQRTREH